MKTNTPLASTNTTRTDRDKSIAAEEFVWDTAECSDVHNYVGGPILRQLKQQNARQVLDLGCGNGAFTDYLAQQGYEVVGTEYSRSGIEMAQGRYPNVKFEHYDVMDPLPAHHAGQYDAAVAIEVIEHLLLPRKLMENALAALKPGGLFIVTTPFHGYWKNLALAVTNKYDDHWHPLRDFGHVKFFSKATLTQLFKECGLTDIHFETVGRLPMFARSMIVSGRKAC